MPSVGFIPEVGGVNPGGCHVANSCFTLLLGYCPLMGYSRKKQKGGEVEDMEFQGNCRNSKWVFRGLIKNKVEFPGMIKKKSCGIFSGLGFRP